jgi:hypothetical protein
VNHEADQSSLLQAAQLNGLSTRSLSSLTNVLSGIRWIGGGLVAITLWVAWVQFSIIRDGSDIDRTRGMAEDTRNLLKDYISSDKLTEQTMETQIKINLEELQRHNKQFQELDELWFMKEHGLLRPSKQ